ncbi:MAG: carbohydrate ABC transporter permease [Bacilli bacterium]
MSKYSFFLLSKEARGAYDFKKRQKHSKVFLREERTALLFILLPIIGFCIFIVYPAIRALFLSFTDYNLFNMEGYQFVGIANYIKIFNDKRFLNACLNTVVLLVGIPLGITAGLLIATYINRASKGSKLLSLLYYLPAVTSAIVIAVIWNYIFNIKNGVINNIFGLKFFDWFDSKDFFVSKIAILIKGVWGGIGGTMLLFLAGLNNIPFEYYEASKIDGASGFQQFVHITIPMVKPTTFYLIVTGIIGHLQAYADAKFFASAAGDQVTTIVYYMWNNLYNNGDYNLLGTVGTVFALVVIAITAFQFSRSKMFDI